MDRATGNGCILEHHCDYYLKNCKSLNVKFTFLLTGEMSISIRVVFVARILLTNVLQFCMRLISRI